MDTGIESLPNSEAHPVKATLVTLARRAQDGFITVGDAAAALGVDRRAASARLGSLSLQGWAARVRRGLYYILPLEAGEPVIAPDPWILAAHVYPPCYIAGWSAAEHWGLTEQIFSSTFVATAASIRCRTPRLLRSDFRLARVQPARLEHASVVWRGTTSVMVSDPEVTIADALIEPSWAGGMRHLTDILTNYSESQSVHFPKILDCLRRLRRGAGIKRFGYLMEQLFPAETDVVKRAQADLTTGNVRLDPGLPRRGHLSKRWGLWVNVSVRSLASE